MAEYLNKAHTRMRVVLACCGLFAFHPTFAQGLPDPTRPPASLEMSSGRNNAADAGPQLQSVLISSSRKLAIIDGQTVRLGEKFGDARLVKVTESEVVLQNGRDAQTLRLFPQIEKQHAGRRGASSPNVDSLQRLK